jgi:hypothetical protein
MGCRGLGVKRVRVQGSGFTDFGMEFIGFRVYG